MFCKHWHLCACVAGSCHAVQTGAGLLYTSACWPLSIHGILHKCSQPCMCILLIVYRPVVDACALIVGRHITADNASWFNDRGCVLKAYQRVTAMVAVHRLVYHSKYSVKSHLLHKTLNFCVHWLYSLALEKFTMKIVIKLITVHKYKCTIHRKTLGHNSPSGIIKRSLQTSYRIKFLFLRLLQFCSQN